MDSYNAAAVSFHIRFGNFTAFEFGIHSCDYPDWRSIDSACYTALFQKLV